MITNYVVKLKNTSGTLQYEFTDFESLSYVNRVNDAGAIILEMYDGGRDLPFEVGDKWMIEVWRENRDNDIDNYRDFIGLVRDISVSGEDPSLVTFRGVGLNDMLRWRVVGWYANHDFRSAFTGESAGHIMQFIVYYNLGDGATEAEGRIREGDLAFVTHFDDVGPDLDWYCAWDNVLETLQELAEISGLDFAAEHRETGGWDFRTYENQLGDDRRDELLFSIAMGNMGNPIFMQHRLGERTVGIVAGEGEEDDREVIIREGPNYDSDNDIEMFIDARGSKTTEALEAKGDAKLEETKAREEFTFEVLQTEGAQYGRDYFLGDLVTAENPFTGNQVDRKVSAVTISLDSEDVETINVEVSTP